MIDANTNRAREGLRVLEDLARFVLNDQPTAAALKSCRHNLTEAVARLLPTDPGTTDRDAEGDVGRTIATDSEGRRPDLRAVAAAAGARVGEALRVIEEAAKTIGDATAIEAVRYRAYDAAGAVARSLAPDAPQWSLCVLITEALCAHPWDRVAEAALAGGADAIQLREKSLPDGELVARARTLVSIAGGARTVINDRPDIALLAGAHAVHLGRGDLSVADARAVAGSGLLVGASCSSADAARSAVRAGASSLGLGAMFGTETKDNPDVRGASLLTEVLSDPDSAALPHLAIGGITPANAREVVAAGARGIAVSSCVCGAGDPAGVCGELSAIVRTGRGS